MIITTTTTATTIITTTITDGPASRNTEDATAMHVAAIGGLETVVLGLLLIVVAFVLRRTAKRKQQLRDRDVAGEVRKDLLADAPGGYPAGRSLIEQLEVRLHDHRREVEALAETRIAHLHRLIATADETIAELRDLLQRIRDAGEERPPVCDDDEKPQAA